MSTTKLNNPAAAAIEAKKAAMPGNMDLWDKVCKTDPEHTKKFDNGYFKGTSIKPYHTFARATEIFGPCGIGWGYTIKDERFDDGTPMISKDGADLGPSKTHTLVIDFNFELNGKKGTITSIGQTPYATMTSGGKLRTDHDAVKKSLTDAIGKALSMLGFGADIFQGLFDSADYVSEIRDEFAIEKADDKAGEERKQQAAYEAELERNIELIKTSVNTRELQVLFDNMSKKCLKRDDKASIIRMMKEKDIRMAFLADKKKTEDQAAEDFKKRRREELATKRAAAEAAKGEKK